LGYAGVTVWQEWGNWMFGIGLEWVILGVCALVAWGVIVGKAYSRRRSQSVGEAMSSSGMQSGSAQLIEADRLLAAGQISQAEHELTRSRILGIAPPDPR